MAINREQRRKVADNLAAFMRGEISDNEYLDRGQEIHEEIKNSDQPDKFALYNAAFEWMNPPGGDHTLSTDETTWKAMCCRLAFLESDLEMKREGYEDTPGPGTRGLLVAVVIASVAVGLYYSWFGANIGMYFTLWAGIGIGVRVALEINARMSFKKQPPDRFHPFNDEQQFEEQRHLLDRHKLPVYDPLVHQQRTGASTSVLTCVVGGILVLLATLLRNLSWLIVGPLMLLAFFKAERTPHYVAVKGDES